MADGSLERRAAAEDRTRRGVRSTGAAIAGRGVGIAAQVGGRVVALADRISNRAMNAAEDALGAAIDSVLDSPRTERLLERALAQPGLQRLVDRVIGSELSEHATDELLRSDELDRLVTEIARSPQVRQALAAQSSNLANEVGNQVRGRAAAGDATVERVAQRLIGRRGRVARAGESGTGNSGRGEGETPDASASQEARGGD